MNVLAAWPAHAAHTVGSRFWLSNLAANHFMVLMNGIIAKPISTSRSKASEREMSTVSRTMKIMEPHASSDCCCAVCPCLPFFPLLLRFLSSASRRSSAFRFSASSFSKNAKKLPVLPSSGLFALKRGRYDFAATALKRGFVLFFLKARNVSTSWRNSAACSEPDESLSKPCSTLAVSAESPSSPSSESASLSSLVSMSPDLFLSNFLKTSEMSSSTAGAVAAGGAAGAFAAW